MKNATTAVIALDILAIAITIGLQFPWSERLIYRLMQWCLDLVKVLFTPKLLLTFGIAWFITNGWSYVALAVGVKYNITWLATVGGTWLTILWIPGTPEKILTVAIAIWLAKILFPRDTELQAQLNKLKLVEINKTKKEKNANEARNKN